MFVLETERLALRHLKPDDLDALATIQSDPEVMRFFAAGPPHPPGDPPRAGTLHRGPGRARIQPLGGR